MAESNYRNIAQQIVGKNNIISVTHCAYLVVDPNSDINVIMALLFSVLWVNSISFLPRNQNGKAHRNSKRRYSPCNLGYTT